MYTIIFADDKKFIFTKEQIMLIPYFNTLITSSSFSEKDIINISSSSVGFEYIHMYATMDEIDIIDPNDKYLFVIKQCDYFGYDKLKTLLEEKYGYKTDITDAKDKTGKETTVKIKYLGKICINKRNTPIFTTNTQGSTNCRSYEPTYSIDNFHINKEGYILELNKKNICPEYNLYKYFNKININKHHHHGSGGFGGEDKFSCYVNGIDIVRHVEQIFNINNLLYAICPIYEYPDYSTDEEISDIFKKRYRAKYNTYFVKMIQNTISFGKDDIICVKIKDTYKLLSETSEDEYNNVECIIVDNEPKFNDKYFIKYIDDNLEIFELI